MKRSGVNGCWGKSIAREHCGTKLTSFSALAATKWDSACRKAPKKGKILPLACHYCCPTTVTEKRSTAQSMSGGGVPIRSGKKGHKNPSKEAIEMYTRFTTNAEMHIFWVRVCVHVFYPWNGRRTGRPKMD